MNKTIANKVLATAKKMEEKRLRKSRRLFMSAVEKKVKECENEGKNWNIENELFEFYKYFDFDWVSPDTPNRKEILIKYANKIVTDLGFINFTMNPGETVFRVWLPDINDDSIKGEAIDMMRRHVCKLNSLEKANKGYANKFYKEVLEKKFASGDFEISLVNSPYAEKNIFTWMYKITVYVEYPSDITKNFFEDYLTSILANHKFHFPVFSKNSIIVYIYEK